MENIILDPTNVAADVTVEMDSAGACPIVSAINVPSPESFLAKITDLHLVIHR
jgi:hypothetical protein